METQDFIIEYEENTHLDQIESLTAFAFGPGRFARSAFRLREGITPEKSLCFVATKAGKLIGSVRLTRTRIGSREALLLGPLVVSPNHKCNGIGAGLMDKAVSEAKALGEELIILVGDLSYYGKFGFHAIPEGKITLPGPADPNRILGCELKDGAFGKFRGQVTKAA